jgi:hypothetical protein
MQLQRKKSKKRSWRAFDPVWSVRNRNGHSLRGSRATVHGATVGQVKRAIGNMRDVTKVQMSADGKYVEVIHTAHSRYPKFVYALHALRKQLAYGWVEETRASKKRKQ